MTKNEKKQLLRKTMLKKRSALDADIVITAENQALSTVAALLSELAKKKYAVETKSQLTVMSYMSYKNEFPTHGVNEMILRKGHRLVLPFTDSSFSIIPCYANSLDELVTSPMGISEPDPDQAVHASLSDIDLILLPGVAFDIHGNRIGFGKGCYDRFLDHTVPLLVGLAYDFQIHDEIPAEETDVPCNYLISESGLKIRK